MSPIPQVNPQFVAKKKMDNFERHRMTMLNGKAVDIPGK
jgi:hypothetical protein